MLPVQSRRHRMPPAGRCHGGRQLPGVFREGVGAQMLSQPLIVNHRRNQLGAGDGGLPRLPVLGDVEVKHPAEHILRIEHAADKIAQRVGDKHPVALPARSAIQSAAAYADGFQ